MKWSEFKAIVERAIKEQNEGKEVTIDPEIAYIDWENSWGDNVISIDFFPTGEITIT